MNWIVASQAEMDEAMRLYFATLSDTQAGTFNAMLAPEFLSCSYSRKTLRVRMRIQGWMLNPINHLHGGVAASILDFTMGVLSRVCAGGAMTPTVSMNVDYLRSMQGGELLVAEAVCTKIGRTLMHLTASAWSADTPQKQVLTATATYFSVPDAG